MALDQKVKDTVIWSAIYNAAATAVEGIINSVAFSGLIGYGIGASTGFVSAAVNGAIIGAIVGYVLAAWYPKVMEINKKYLGNKFNSLFKVLFYPYLIGAAISFLSALGFASIFGIAPILAIAGTVATRYAYAKLLTAKVGHYYPQQ